MKKVLREIPKTLHLVLRGGGSMGEGGVHVHSHAYNIKEAMQGDTGHRLSGQLFFFFFSPNKFNITPLCYMLKDSMVCRSSCTSVV